MIITPITTRPITTSDKSLTKILDQYVTVFADKNILVITSKIVSLAEGSVAKANTNLEKLVHTEADAYLPPESNKYSIALTIKDSILIPNAGIDHSNSGDMLTLWPKNAQKTANDVRAYLLKRFKIKQCGVIITDSKTTPLRWGVTGVAIAHSGFAALNDYRGKPDIFGKKLEVTQSNVADGLAAAAVLAMGEGQEQTPLAIVTDAAIVVFQDHNPTKKELDDLAIDPKDDLYAPLLQSVKWHKGS